MPNEPTVLYLTPGRRLVAMRAHRVPDLALLGLGSGYALLVDWRALPLVVAFGVYVVLVGWSMHRPATPGARMIFSDHCIQLVRGNHVQTVQREDLAAIAPGPLATRRDASGADWPGAFRLGFWDRVAAEEALRRHGWLDLTGSPR
ncbi:MAG: hypothetical protein JWM47_2571 [Acidimicrobiales bacterium]|nr:hypothetical protein [Acidimicrobiales bacterium]